MQMKYQSNPTNKKFSAAILERNKLLLAKPTHREVRKCREDVLVVRMIDFESATIIAKKHEDSQSIGNFGMRRWWSMWEHAKCVEGWLHLRHVHV
jgi:hypothetical protein